MFKPVLSRTNLASLRSMIVLLLSFEVFEVQSCGVLAVRHRRC